MGKEQELRCNFRIGVVGCKNKEEAFNQIEECFARENRTAENEFWENMELIEIIEE